MHACSTLHCITLRYITLHTYLHTYIHMHTHAYMHACTHAYMHTCTHAYMHACTHACMLTYLDTTIQKHRHRVRNDMHTYISTYLPEYMQTCIHTHSFQKRGLQRDRQTDKQIDRQTDINTCMDDHGCMQAWWHACTYTQRTMMKVLCLCPQEHGRYCPTPPHTTRATRPQVSYFFALGAQVSEISGAQVSA